jgi:hypothetical protein
MKRYSKMTNNPDRVGKDTKQIIYFEELRGYELMPLVSDWIMMNNKGEIIEGLAPKYYSRSKDKTEKLLLVKKINKKIKEIETLINKLEETEIDRLERGKDKEE